MSVETLTAPSAASQRAVATTDLPVGNDPLLPQGGSPSRFRWRQPGWPLTYLLVGYPLWWVLGVTGPALLLSAVIMAVQLVRSGQVRARLGFGQWLIFLVWVCVGVLTLQVNAPGAVPGESGARYITFAYRLLLYLAATSVLLYVYNFRSRIPTTRILRAFAWFFVTVVAGGVLGASAPYLTFPSAMELILPHGISHIQFVQVLIHPRVAQVIDPAHPSGTPRTSAPFTYTNDWGLSFACLLPFFLLAWFDRTAGWRRWVAPWILLISIYPVVQSANRGLWIALVVSGAIVVVRAMAFGNIKFAATAVVAAAATLGVLLSTPLGSTVIFRLTNAGSAGGRSTLGVETLRSVAQVSPVVGLGTTRAVQGSFYSIAGGDSATCVGCAPPPLGTQGHFWLVAFSTGYGGLVLYLGFILIQLFRHIRLRTPVATLGITVLVVHLTTMVIYDTVGMSLFIIFAGIGLLWQEQAKTDGIRPDRSGRETGLGSYVRLVSRGRVLMATCALLGLAGGLLFHGIRGTRYEAITSVTAPVGHISSTTKNAGLSVDTVAGLIGAPAVRQAVESAVGSRLAPSADQFYITAIKNTRVLQVHVVDARPEFAVRASRAAGTALISVRENILETQRADEVRALQRQRSAYLTAASTIATLRVVDPQAKPLTTQRAELIGEIAATDKQLVRLEDRSINPGTLLATAPALARNDAWIVAGASGLMLGLLFAVLELSARRARGNRLQSERDLLGLPVLARIAYRSAAAAPHPPEIDRIARVLGGLGSVTVLSADDAPLTCATSVAVERALARRREVSVRTPRLVVLIAGPSTRDCDLEHVRQAMADLSAPVVGVVLLTKAARGARTHFTKGLPWPTSGPLQETHS